MRQISKNPIKLLKIKADKAFQDWLRRTYPKQKCEACGIRTFYCGHHHLLKSKSNAGRFNLINIVFLCKLCHDKLHFSDLQVVAKYSARKGDEWIKRMDELAREKMPPFSKKELLEFIEIYAQN